MIIGLHGSIGEGKDTITNMIIEKLPKFENKKFAEKLKTITGVLTGVDPINFENEDFKNKTLPDPWKHPVSGGKITYRFLLAYFGTELFREKFDPNFWVNSLFSDYTNNSNFLISDVRFVNEFTAIKRKGGVNILVRRFKKISEWLESDNFKGILKLPTDEFIRGYCNGDDHKIWKQELVSMINTKHGIINHYSENWKKLTHVSERDLYINRNNIKPFDYIIDNDSTIDQLKEKVDQLSKEIKNKFL